MTPQIKARELVEKFYDKIEDFDLEHDDPEMSLRMKYAKACAIICVDESIESMTSIIGCREVFWTDREKDIIVFYQSVREEILKIK